MPYHCRSLYLWQKFWKSVPEVTLASSIPTVYRGKKKVQKRALRKANLLIKYLLNTPIKEVTQTQTQVADMELRTVLNQTSKPSPFIIHSLLHMLVYIILTYNIFTITQLSFISHPLPKSSELNSTTLSHFHHFREGFFKASIILKLREKWEMRDPPQTWNPLALWFCPADSSGENLFPATVISPHIFHYHKVFMLQWKYRKTRGGIPTFSALNSNLLKSSSPFTILTEAQPAYWVTIESL